MATLFEYIKENVLLSDYVQSLSQVNGFHSTGRNTYRCNNVISGGGNNTSMLVNDDGGYFKIYSGDKEAGDVIKLYSIINSIDNQKEAAIGLANDMGVKIPEELLMTGNRGESKTDMKKAMKNICDMAFQELIDAKSDDADTALGYILDRGASMDMIERWKLGFMPSDIDEARNFLKSASPSNRVLSKVGMMGGKDEDFPIMAGRLLFPIFSLRGEPISFSSRKIPGIPSNLDGKYVNTSNTPIYEKHETLLGQHLLEKDLDNIIICEGNFDVIALNEMTKKGTVAVATCGTALTTSHVAMLKRFKPKRVTIIFDGDSSGRKSAASLVWVCNHLKHVGIITLDEGEDPWDIYASGETISTTSDESAIVTATRIASEDLEKEDFADWFEQTHRKLVFSDDRNTLLNASARLTGIRKGYLASLVGGENQKDKKKYSPEGNNNEFSLSPSVIAPISALLSMESLERRSVAFPLYRNAMFDIASEMSGVLTDDDEDALLIAMGINLQDADERLSSYVWGLTPDTDEVDQRRIDAARIIARLLTKFILEEKITCLPSGYITAISKISSGASIAKPIDQLSFLFDALATSLEE